MSNLLIVHKGTGGVYGLSDGGGTQIGRFVWLSTGVAFGWVGGLAVGLLEDCSLLPEMKQLH